MKQKEPTKTFMTIIFKSKKTLVSMVYRIIFSVVRVLIKTTYVLKFPRPIYVPHSRIILKKVIELKNI